MISKNEVKYIQSLYHKKTRDDEALFIAEGPKLVDELQNSDYVIRKIYAVDKWINRHKAAPYIQSVTWNEMERISNLQTPNQVLAIAEQKENTSSPILAGTITLVADGIQDPGNFGTLIRLADWFGLQQIVASIDTVDMYNPKVVQATMGSFVRVFVWYEDLKSWLKQSPVSIYGALLHGDNVYTAGPITEGLLIAGNEAKGIREELLPFIQHAITIPRTGKAESLNVAVATGIILSHIISQP